eukprot:560601-Prymnesium_polylepis.3
MVDALSTCIDGGTITDEGALSQTEVAGQELHHVSRAGIRLVPVLQRADDAASVSPEQRLHVRQVARERTREASHQRVTHADGVDGLEAVIRHAEAIQPCLHSRGVLGRHTIDENEADGARDAHDAEAAESIQKLLAPRLGRGERQQATACTTMAEEQRGLIVHAGCEEESVHAREEQLRDA